MAFWHLLAAATSLAMLPRQFLSMKAASKLKPKQLYLMSNGDLRLSANQKCWPEQARKKDKITKVLRAEGWKTVRAHAFDKKKKHGFIDSQKMGMEVFRKLDPNAPLIVAECVWQYSHHLLHGLFTHRGPILTVANWSGTWPGLVGMLNLNGSMTKAGIRYSSLWSEQFQDSFFRNGLRQWLAEGTVTHDQSHVRDLRLLKLPLRDEQIGRQAARRLKREKAILGVFDEGCMGMFNAIIPDELLHPTGLFKERLSQSALYHETIESSDAEAKTVRRWMEERGMKFHTGSTHESDLTDAQILLQCKMYLAAVRLADDFGCDLIGIQYQQGLKDLLPASDLVEGTLNNADRPPVRSRDGGRVLFPGEPVVHFNEVDECAGLDALLTYRVQKATSQPVETTLHDIRWGDVDRSGTVDDYVWVFLISGAAPPAHFIGGWAGAEGFRQPAMYFPNGGSTLRGISRPGEIVWSRIYVENDALHMDIGRGHVVQLPREETERRWQATTPEWPIMHGVLNGVSRDALMAKHKSNHIQVVYSNSPESADFTLQAKSMFAHELGISVNLCGKLN